MVDPCDVTTGQRLVEGISIAMEVVMEHDCTWKTGLGIFAKALVRGLQPASEAGIVCAFPSSLSWSSSCNKQSTNMVFSSVVSDFSQISLICAGTFPALSSLLNFHQNLWNAFHCDHQDPHSHPVPSLLLLLFLLLTQPSKPLLSLLAPQTGAWRLGLWYHLWQQAF